MRDALIYFPRIQNFGVSQWNCALATQRVCLVMQLLLWPRIVYWFSSLHWNKNEDTESVEMGVTRITDPGMTVPATRFVGVMRTLRGNSVKTLRTNFYLERVVDAFEIPFTSCCLKKPGWCNCTQGSNSRVPLLLPFCYFNISPVTSCLAFPQYRPVG